MSEVPTRTPYLREGLLLLGFVLLLAASALSVVVPELAKEPEADDPLRSAADAGTAVTKP
jgi:hypothetical protein